MKVRLLVSQEWRILQQPINGLEDWSTTTNFPQGALINNKYRHIPASSITTTLEDEASRAEAIPIHNKEEAKAIDNQFVTRQLNVIIHLIKLSHGQVNSKCQALPVKFRGT